MRHIGFLQMFDVLIFSNSFWPIADADADIYKKISYFIEENTKPLLFYNEPITL